MELHLHSPICLSGMHRDSFAINEIGWQIDSEKTKYVSLFMLLTKSEKCHNVKLANFRYF
jgi:hypothetical protein